MQDEVLIVGLKRGLITTQERFYNYYKGQVLAQCCKILHNYHDAEDATSIALYKAIKNIKKFKGDCKLESWLYRIALNECLMIIRKRKNKEAKTIYFQDVLKTQVDQIKDRDEPKQEAHTLISYEMLEDPILRRWANLCYLHLRPEYQVVIDLAAIGLSTPHAAKLLNFTLPQYKSRLFRARIDFKRAVNG